MKLYDSMIEELPSYILAEESYSYSYDNGNSWAENQDYEMIMQKDSAYELGGVGCASVNYTMVTSNSEYVKADEIVVYGKELQDISKDVSYARIAIVRVKDSEAWNSDSDKLYQMLSDIDFIKYHVYTRGYMIRSSGQSHREQVRISRKELKAGMTFEKIGNTIINHYKDNPTVAAVKLIFITGDTTDYARLNDCAKRAAEIRKSLSIINKNLDTECSTCGIRDICNEVEGLKELHFGKKSIRERQTAIL